VRREQATDHLAGVCALHSPDSFQTYIWLNRSLLAAGLVLFAMLFCSLVFHPPTQATEHPTT
jgi:hypothetical protein